jgi:hypothetical protein
MDFMVGLLASTGFNRILVVFDCQKKMRNLVHCVDNLDGMNLGEMNVEEVFQLHVLPNVRVSDQGPQFAMEFLKHVCERLAIE